MGLEDKGSRPASIWVLRVWKERLFEQLFVLDLAGTHNAIFSILKSSHLVNLSIFKFENEVKNVDRQRFAT